MRHEYKITIMGIPMGSVPKEVQVHFTGVRGNMYVASELQSIFEKMVSDYDNRFSHLAQFRALLDSLEELNRYDVARIAPFNLDYNPIFKSNESVFEIITRLRVAAAGAVGITREYVIENGMLGTRLVEDYLKTARIDLSLLVTEFN